MFELHAAAAEANIDKVRKLIAEGADANEFDDRGETPLHSLIMHFLVFHYSKNIEPIVEIIDLLLAAKADINAKTKRGQERTILHSVAEFKVPELTKRLLQRNADVNCVTDFGDTPLHLAVSSSVGGVAYQDQNDTVKLLLERGASINAINDVGFKPTTISESSRNPTLHTLLLQYGVPSIEKTQSEKELNSLFSKFSNFFIKPTHQEQPHNKTLTKLAAQAAINIRYNSTHSKEEYYKRLLQLPQSLLEEYPELEFRPPRLFIYKVNKILERKADIFEETTHPKELTYLRRIKASLNEKEPYNGVRKIMQELDEEFKRGYLSVFKDNMKPVREQIVQAMREYLVDKDLYRQYASQPSV